MSVLEEYLELVRAATAEIESLRQQLAESKVILQEAQALRSRLAEAKRLIRRAYGAVGTLRRMATGTEAYESYDEWQREANAWLRAIDAFLAREGKP
jgi:hypothetical protein